MQRRPFREGVVVFPAVLGAALAGLLIVVLRTAPPSVHALPEALPVSPPYLQAETRDAATPLEKHFEGRLNPGKCATCHSKVFQQWNGSMMSNAWRDPAWRGAFYLVSRLTSTA